MKDGRFVSNWNNFGDYVIEHVTEEDQGGYSCLASSSAGLIQSSVAYMTVNGKLAISAQRLKLIGPYGVQKPTPRNALHIHLSAFVVCFRSAEDRETPK